VKGKAHCLNLFPKIIYASLKTLKLFSERFSLSKPQTNIPRWNKRPILDKISFLSSKNIKYRFLREVNTERSMDIKRETREQFESFCLPAFETELDWKDEKPSKFRLNLSEINEPQGHVGKNCQIVEKVGTIGTANPKENTCQHIWTHFKQKNKGKPFSSQQLK